MRIAEGDYIFWIVKAEVNGGMLNVTFESRSISLAEPFPLSGPGVWKLRELLEACGKEVNSAAFEKMINGRKPKIDVKKLIGLECGGTVLDDCGKSVIAAFFPAMELKRTFSILAREAVSETNAPRYVM
jgi:hypothetical protein